MVYPGVPLGLSYGANASALICEDNSHSEGHYELCHAVKKTMARDDLFVPFTESVVNLSNKSIFERVSVCRA